MTWQHRRVVAVVLALAVGMAGCTGDDSAAEGSDDREAVQAAPGDDTEGAVAEPVGTGSCDDTDPTACLLPWPNDAFTRADPSTPTGRRLDLPPDGMPANSDGDRIDPLEWNRNDGFSPASIPTVVVRGVDPEASGLPPITDIGASVADGSPLVLLDLDTGDRVPAWAELDVAVGDEARRPLRIVPARGLVPGHRHTVGLWGLVDADGTAIEPSDGFAAALAEPDEAQAEWLGALTEDGPGGDPDVGWAFTVASDDSLTGRLRHMWAETAEDLGVGADGATDGAGSPPFEVTEVGGEGSVRIVGGTFAMPRYLTGDGGPGSVFAYDVDPTDDPDALPVADGTMDAAFTCVVPAGADGPAPFVVYGHGLLGSRSEVLDIGTLGAAVGGIGFCALDYLGMSTEDVPVVLSQFEDMTRFTTQADRLQQGHLGFALLGRLLADPGGFSTDPAFRSDDGAPLVDHGAVGFLGASQGGILGGPATAISPDWDRAIFAVGGMSYNLLLRRSINFDRFEPPLEASYPDELDRSMVIELIQGLWDRGENAGWAHRLGDDPLPESGGPSTLMLLTAFGDHQVANVATEKLARTLRIARVAPTLAEGRSSDLEPQWGIPPIESLPHEGSAYVLWDFGTPAPPTSNTPPREGDDPHGKLADVPEALALVLAFITPGGEVIDVCGGQPCSSSG